MLIASLGGLSIDPRELTCCNQDIFMRNGRDRARIQVGREDKPDGSSFLLFLFSVETNSAICTEESWRQDEVNFVHNNRSKMKCFFKETY
jgi:hypothetical protein